MTAPAAAAAAAALKAVTLTHVRYRPGDRLGHFLAWVSLIPVFISLGGFVSHFIFRREFQGLFFALGLIVSQVLNELIKTSVQQSRPDTCSALEACDSHGWPSSHSQYMFFFAAYLTLLSLRCKTGVSSTASNLFLAALPWPLALLTMYSRVYLGYHTVAQVFKYPTFFCFPTSWCLKIQLFGFFILVLLKNPIFFLVVNPRFGEYCVTLMNSAMNSIRCLLVRRLGWCLGRGGFGLSTVC